MCKVVCVRFKDIGKIYHFDANSLQLAEGDLVIVDTAHGQEIGSVVGEPFDKDAGESGDDSRQLKKVIRVASNKDLDMQRQFKAQESDAFAACQKCIDGHKLDMRLVGAEYSFNGSRLLFYFTADERVDFRALVKDLASIFKTRIELRQIGVRDEAKLLGGLGSCGLHCCCNRFLNDFQPVSIRMAKEQNLSLNPTKISGLCGRLMCCLQYEHEHYEDMRKKMPSVSKDVMTPDGKGVVVDNNVLTEKTKVRVALPDGSFDLREYPYETLKIEKKHEKHEKQKQ